METADKKLSSLGESAPSVETIERRMGCVKRLRELFESGKRVDQFSVDGVMSELTTQLQPTTSEQLILRSFSELFSEREAVLSKIKNGKLLPLPQGSNVPETNFDTRTFPHEMNQDQELFFRLTGRIASGSVKAIFSPVSINFRLAEREDYDKVCPEEGDTSVGKVLELERLDEVGLYGAISVSWESKNSSEKIEVTENHELVHCYFQLLEDAIQQGLANVSPRGINKEMKYWNERLQTEKTPEGKRHVVRQIIDILREFHLDKCIKHEVVAWVHEGVPAEGIKMGFQKTYLRDWIQKMNFILDDTISLSGGLLRYAYDMAKTDLYDCVTGALNTIKILEEAHMPRKAIVDFVISLPLHQYRAAGEKLLSERNVSNRVKEHAL